MRGLRPLRVLAALAVAASCSAPTVDVTRLADGSFRVAAAAAGPDVANAAAEARARETCAGQSGATPRILSRDTAFAGGVETSLVTETPGTVSVMAGAPGGSMVAATARDAFHVVLMFSCEPAA